MENKQKIISVLSAIFNTVNNNNNEYTADDINE